MKPTRQRILDYLHAHPASSALEMSQALGVTPVNIRHHLQKLVAAGELEAAESRPPGQRGRPTYLYRINRQHQPNNVHALAHGLLHEMIDRLSLEEQEAALERLAAHMAGSTAVPSGSLARRLGDAVQVLTRQSYQARWEARAEAPRLLLGRCPYASLVGDHPEICKGDAIYLARLIGSPVQQIAHINLETGRPPACVFTVTGSPTAKPTTKPV